MELHSINPIAPGSPDTPGGPGFPGCQGGPKTVVKPAGFSIHIRGISFH